MTENPDHHHYGFVLFYSETMQFFVAALGFYKSLLEKDLAAIKNDPDLKLFLDPEEPERFAAQEEIEKVTRFQNWLKEQLGSEDRFGAHLSITHGSIRFLKSVCQLYLKHLESRRNAIAARPNVSRQALSAVDQRLLALRGKIEVGVFKEATSMPLLSDEVLTGLEVQGEPPQSGGGLASVRVPRPVVIESIEILDQELRTRCLDLFGQFRDSGQHDRLDTVISEATRILEDRLRRLSGAAPTVVGVDLASQALGGTPPRIVLSQIPAEQNAAASLFRGVFGFVRNPVHHKLIADLSPARTLQIVGTIDYLLSLLDAVAVTSASSVSTAP